MSGSAAFWDKIAAKYARDPIKNKAAYQAKLGISQSFLTADNHVFEFGCGTGTTALYHAPKVASIMATDISDNMLTIAQDKKQAAGLENIHFKKWNIDTDALPPEKFDMVMAHSILHLTQDLSVALRKSHDMLRPGGIFVSSTACLGDWNIAYRPLIAIMKLIGKAPHVQFIKKVELKAAIIAAGFEIIDQAKPVGGEAEFIIARKV